MPKQGILPTIYVVVPGKQLRMRNHPENSLKQYGPRNILGTLRLALTPAFAWARAALKVTSPKGLRLKKKSSLHVEIKLTHYRDADNRLF